MNKIKNLILPPVVLTLICAAVALMLGWVHSVTAEPIRQAEERAKTEAIYAVFPDAVEIKTVPLPEGTDPDRQINVIYSVRNGDSFIGYAVNVTVGSGYGGEINMTVGISSECKVCGLEIVSHSETAGLGARIDELSFRQRFSGLSDRAVIGENVDAISGATISSKAVAAGVNAALNAVSGFFGGSEGKLSLAPARNTSYAEVIL